jgi:hypothetical protein
MLRDVDLIDDIITLRRQLAEAERQRDNALEKCMALRAALATIAEGRDALKDLAEIAARLSCED